MTDEHSDGVCKLLNFLRFRAEDLVMVRVLADPAGGRGSADVAAASDMADLERLLLSAAREPYYERDGTQRRYQGTYARLCHSCAPRDWLYWPDRPKLTAESATRYPAFFVDIDARRAVAGASATDAEQQVTADTASEIMKWMDDVLGPDRSYALQIASGNGAQLVIRVDFGVEFCWVPRVLLARMTQRWPNVDTAGWSAAMGPAMPGTIKCKGDPTPERPHRMVQVAATYEGDRFLGVEELHLLINSLPEAKNETAASGGTFAAYDEFSAVATLDVGDVCEQELQQRVICPVCRSSDSSVAIVRPNLVTCQHRHRCPAARVGRTGFTAQHVYAMLLGYGWGPWTPEQRAEIVRAAIDAGWDLVYDDGRERAVSPTLRATVARQMKHLLGGEPPRHKSIRGTVKWVLRSKSAREAAFKVHDAIVDAYAPDYRDQRPIVMAGRLMVYNQDLGIWTGVTSSDEARDTPRVARILGEQENGLGIWAAGKRWSPPTGPVLAELELLCSVPNYFRAGKVGIACRDGFIELHAGQWRTIEHSPANRALGRIRKSASSVLAEIARGNASEAIQALRVILIKTLRRDDAMVDDVLRIFVQQLGAVLCRAPAELRSGMVLHGAADTGKSCLLRIAEAMARRVGLNVTSASITDLNSTFPPEQLLTSALNLKMEESSFDSGKPVRSERLKQIAEGSMFSFARKHMPSIDVCLQPLWLAACNSEPVFAEASAAISKRFVIVPYPATPTPFDQLDFQLVPRFLGQHLDGLIAASLVGAAELTSKGRSALDPKSELYLHSQELGRTPSLIEAWLATSGTQQSDHPDRDAPYNDAHTHAVEWGTEHGYRDAAVILTPTRFTRELNKYCTRKVRRSHHVSFAPVILAAQTETKRDMPSDGSVKI